jgi:putative endonuclease
MYFVYLLKLQNQKNRFYIGMTGDIKRRTNEHRRGKVKTTTRLGAPRLIYYEAYIESTQAIEREKQLKRFGSAYSGLLKRLGEK